jgi:hypothetical protein
MKHPKSWIAVFVALLVFPVVFAADNINRHPGYVDFSSLTALAKDEPNVEIALKEPLLNMITNIIKESDAQSAKFISRLLRVDVKVFGSSNIDTDLMSNTMSGIAQELDRQRWDRVVRVREDDDHVDVYFRLSDNGELIHGIAIMVSTPDETVLVNIVGDISPNDISALAQRFDIDELAEVDFQPRNNNAQ